MNEPETSRPLPLDYAVPVRRRGLPRPWGLIVPILLAVGIVALLISILLPSCCASPEGANRVKCAANLRSLGQSLAFYANEHGGRYPDTLSELFLAGDMSSGQAVCPSGNDDAAAGPTTQAIAAEIATPGHCSYVYLGKGLTSGCPPQIILVHERLENHGKQGMNVLYGDGSVQWTSPAGAARILAELAAGHNPPRPATQPAPLRGP